MTGLFWHSLTFTNKAVISWIWNSAAPSVLTLVYKNRKQSCPKELACAHCQFCWYNIKHQNSNTIKIKKHDSFLKLHSSEQLHTLLKTHSKQKANHKTPEQVCILYSAHPVGNITLTILHIIFLVCQPKRTSEHASLPDPCTGVIELGNILLHNFKVISPVSSADFNYFFPRCSEELCSLWF